MLGPSAMMVVRELERRPLRFALSTLGIAMGLAIFVMGRFSNDSFDHLMADVYPREHQEDLMVTFARSQPVRIVGELAHVRGVMYAEGERDVAARLHAGSRWRDVRIVGLPDPPVLRHLLDDGRRPVALPAEGVIVTDKLAEVLGVHPGDVIEADVLEGDWGTRRLPIAGTVREAFGLQAYARAEWVSRMMREAPRESGVLLRVDPAANERVRAALKDDPAVIGVTSTARVIASYRAQTGQSVLVMTVILTVAAAAIAIGVVYNNARIALSLRSRDLATLRVLGFSRREISSVLLGELGVQVALGIPLGLLFGTLAARALAIAFSQETIRFSLYIAPRTYVAAAVIALVSGAVSALLVRRKLDQLDLVAVLKSSWE
jgi:putative ABC transport system permease protein